MKPIEELLITAKARGASDLLVMVGDSPAMRVAGEWRRFVTPRCTVQYIEAITRAMLREGGWEELQTKRELDFSASFSAMGRVRCNVHFQRDHLAIVLRLVWPDIPEPAKLGL